MEVQSYRVYCICLIVFHRSDLCTVDNLRLIRDFFWILKGVFLFVFKYFECEIIYNSVLEELCICWLGIYHWLIVFIYFMVVVALIFNFFVYFLCLCFFHVLHTSFFPIALRTALSWTLYRFDSIIKHNLEQSWHLLSTFCQPFSQFL